jgi:Dockerin type I domain
LLNGTFDPSASYAEWSTAGFSTIPFPFFNRFALGPGTGPLTFWVNLNALGLSPATNTMDTIVRRVETYIHPRLIDNLPYFAWYTIIQDPGHVNILVVDSNGYTAGILPDGRKTLNIPQSLLFPSSSNPAVVFEDLPDGNYEIVLTGISDGSFELAVSAIAGGHQSSQQVENGTITEGGNAVFLIQLTTTNGVPAQTVSPGVLLVGDLNGDQRVDCADLAIVKQSFGKKSGEPGFNAWADINDDGIVNVLDLQIVASHLPAGTTCQ